MPPARRHSAVALHAAAIQDRSRHRSRIGRYHSPDMQQPIHEIFDQFKQQLPDIDPVETQEWIDSLDAVVEAAGPERARFIIYKLLKRARQLQVGLPTLTQTRYINTISPEQEPYFPGDEAMELKIRRLIRWNALAMVLRANTKFEGIGGHLSTYASAASLYEVGFNHFFRGSDEAPGDQIYFQGHAAPGIYARAFLEGRLTEEHLDHFRRESLAPDVGLSSYPHPRLMPELLAVPDREHGPRPAGRGLPGALQPLPRRARHRGHLERPRVGVPRRRRDGRAGVDRCAEPRRARGARQPDVRRQLQPPAPRRPGARQRQDHPGAGGPLPRRRLARDQGHLGPRVGRPAGPRQGRRPAGQDERHARRRLPAHGGQRRRHHPRAVLRSRSAPARPRRAPDR